MINQNHRTVSLMDMLKIYFSTGVMFLGEIFLVAGVFLFITALDQQQQWIGIFPFLIGAYLVFHKINTVRRSIRPLKFGEFASAKLMEINSTNVRNNKKRVYEYVFRYEVNRNHHEYTYRTAKRTGLSEGMSYDLLYDPSDPDRSIIPQLYNLDSFQRTK